MRIFGPNIKKMKTVGDVVGLGKLLSDSDQKLRNEARIALLEMDQQKTYPYSLCDFVQVLENSTQDSSVAVSLVEKLIAGVKDSPEVESRRTAAQMLVFLFKSGKLPEASSQQILSYRDQITQRHQDLTQHKDGLHYDKTSYGDTSDCSCTTIVTHSDHMATRTGEFYTERINKKTHTDEGVGVKFGL